MQWPLSISLMALVCGVLIAAQFRAEWGYRRDIAGVPSRRVEDLVVMLKEAEQENQRLTQQLMALRERIKHPEQGVRENDTVLPKRWLALQGPGIELTVADSVTPLSQGENPNIAIVHNEDLLKLVNELRASGAEAIAINDQRLVETTEISCAGPTILVNKTRLVPPFVIRAIGDPETMEAALRLRGGVVEYLQFYRIQVSINKKNEVIVPVYHGAPVYRYAKSSFSPNKKPS
jgi:uncharacterized protein YlxW (UPF0749 family)